MLFESFLPFLCKEVTSAIFKQHENEDDLKELLIFVHKKSAKMSKFSLIILIGMSECREALFLSNLSMSFFMSSALTSEKRNVSFSQLFCIASMLGWSLCLKIALRVGSAMCSVTGSSSLYLEIFRSFTIFEKKLFRLSAVFDSFFKISPFSLILILSLILCVICLKVKVSLISRIVCYQLCFLYLSFHSILT